MVPEGELDLPVFYNTVKSLDQVVDVDYYIPGCPPEPHQIWAVLQVVVGVLLEGAPLPPAGRYRRGGQCGRVRRMPSGKTRKDHPRFHRPYEINPDLGVSVCLNRASSAWGRPPAVAAGRSARRWAWAAGAATARCLASMTRAPRCCRLIASVIAVGGPGDG